MRRHLIAIAEATGNDAYRRAAEVLSDKSAGADPVGLLSIAARRMGRPEERDIGGLLMMAVLVTRGRSEHGAATEVAKHMPRTSSATKRLRQPTSSTTQAAVERLRKKFRQNRGKLLEIGRTLALIADAWPELVRSTTALHAKFADAQPKIAGLVEQFKAVGELLRRLGKSRGTNRST